MEGISASCYRSLKGYLRRKSYQRLDGSRNGSKRTRTARMGGGRKRRAWGIKLAPKIRFTFSMPSPKKLLIRIREAYVNMMIRVTQSPALSGGISAGFGGHDSRYGRAFGNEGAIKEYDERLLMEIYKTLMSQGALITNTARSNEIVCRQ